MPKQIVFFEKNKLDIESTDVIVTATQANDYTDFFRNRSNNSAWVTTDSVDSDNTQIDIDFVDEQDLNHILLLKHNFKAYTIQYWNGSTYVDFSTPINETTNSSESTYHVFNDVSTSMLRLIIQGTITPDDDKFLYQFIATDIIGRFEGWPVLNPTLSRNRRTSRLLSGKQAVKEKIGAYSSRVTVSNLRDDNDLTIIEGLFAANEGFLFWPCGGDEDQFSSRRLGYRLEDIYLCKTSNEWNPAFASGIYQTGIVVNMNLVEVIS